MEAIIDVNAITVNKQATEENHVLEFVEMLENGWRYPAITVRNTEFGYVLVDGRHRLEAHKRLSRNFIRARVTL